MLAPFHLRWNKIHEIAGHIGQMHQREEQIGSNARIEELCGPDKSFGRFMEQSIAPAEKHLLDALPQNIIERAILAIADTRKREDARLILSGRTGINMHLYIKLVHRGSLDELTEADHNAFFETSRST